MRVLRRPFFALIALLQLVRAIDGWPVTVGGVELPVWPSWVAAGVAAVLTWFGYRATRADGDRPQVRALRRTGRRAPPAPSRRAEQGPPCATVLSRHGPAKPAGQNSRAVVRMRLRRHGVGLGPTPLAIPPTAGLRPAYRNSGSGGA